MGPGARIRQSFKVKLQSVFKYRQVAEVVKEEARVTKHSPFNSYNRVAAFMNTVTGLMPANLYLNALWSADSRQSTR